MAYPIEEFLFISPLLIFSTYSDVTKTIFCLALQELTQSLCYKRGEGFKLVEMKTVAFIELT